MGGEPKEASSLLGRRQLATASSGCNTVLAGDASLSPSPPSPPTKLNRNIREGDYRHWEKKNIQPTEKDPRQLETSKRRIKSMADYPSSTQRSSWTFDKAVLAEHRATARSRALKQHEDSEFTPSYEQKLLAHYGLKLIQLSRTLKLPDKVTSTACAYLRRFYVQKSCLEVDPQGIVLTCLYLAGKVEDCYLSAERLHSLGGIPEEIILKSELVLLQGLGFDLTCHCVFKALVGGRIEGGKGPFAEESEARGKMDRLLITDAVLIYTPGQLARYCLCGAQGTDSDEVRSGINLLYEEGLDAEKYADEHTQTIDKRLKAERKRLK